MNSTRNKIFSNLLVLIGALAAYFLSACSGQNPGDPTPRVVQVFITATAAPPSATPTQTPTPTRTPTPTPTALPLQAAGEPRALAVLGPTPEPGAFCGLVDTFDFPLNPPDAPDIRGGQDFGVFRERFDKFHAGEDWGIRGGGSLGAPVHAIGHGTVTYADGLGWGLDQGVVIIRHHLPDGSAILSFYGHLDPPSLTVVPGQCVTRGQIIANVGDPSSSPHLHFEIRTTMAHVPGPGYWPDDPTAVGWLPPSETIWAHRMSRMPGFRWQNADLEAQELFGSTGPETILVSGDGFLAGVYTPGGGLRWLQLLEPGVFRIGYSQESGIIYTITASARLEALEIPPEGEPPAGGGFLVRLWERTVPDAIAPVLAPLRGGGIAVLSHSSISAYAPSGQHLWTEPRSGPQVDYLETGGLLLIATGGTAGGLAAYDETGIAWAIEGLAGELAAAGDTVYVLASDALYRIDTAGREPELLMRLPNASRPGEIITLDDGRLLVLHSDLADRRLLLFNNEGALVWERSVRAFLSGVGHIRQVDGRVVLVTQTATQYQQQVYVYLVNLDQPGLELVFEGVTRLPDTGAFELGVTEDGSLLLRFGENSLVAIDLP